MSTSADKLTKENFWNSLMKLYPGEVSRFCLFIDEYKKRVGWDLLFNSSSDYQNAAGKNAPAPKYHDLPVAMQFGIFLEYVMTLPHRYEFYESMPTSWEEMAQNMETWFEQEEKFVVTM